MLVELYTVAWLLAIGSVIFGAFWLNADLRKRIAPKVSLGVSFLLMAVVCGVVWTLLGLIAFLGRTVPALVAAVATFLFATVLARPVAAKLKAGTTKPS